MIPLKFATASQEIPLGVFVDETDGFTAETGLTIANTDIKLWKTGATTLANKNSGGATHISGGIYYAVLDATDTDTYGPLKIFCHVSGARPIELECVVMEADSYDALYAAAGTGHIECDAVQVSGSATAANNAEVVFATDFATNYNTTRDKWQVEADILAISGDSTAADNLESYTDGTTPMPVNATQISGDATAADNCESFFDGTGYNASASTVGNAQVLQRTTIATLASQTSFTLTAGSADNDAYNDSIIVVTDQSTAVQKAIGLIQDYTGSTKTVTLDSDPGIFTMATGDTVEVIAMPKIFGYVLENSETLAEQLRLMRAALVGKSAVSGATVTFRDAADSKNRISATVDVNGQRTAVTPDGT